jgi:hypothetical protein
MSWTSFNLNPAIGTAAKKRKKRKIKGFCGRATAAFRFNQAAGTGTRRGAVETGMNAVAMDFIQTNPSAARGAGPATEWRRI